MDIFIIVDFGCTNIKFAVSFTLVSIGCIEYYCFLLDIISSSLQSSLNQLTNNIQGISQTNNIQGVSEIFYVDL